MITVTEAMDLKIELLEACGLTKEMLKRYYPKRIETEDTIDEAMLKELLKRAIEVDGRTYGVIMTNLIAFNQLCPFCIKYKDCAKCLYGAEFGHCGIKNNTFSKFYNYMEPFFDIKPLQKTRAEKEEIYKRYTEKAESINLKIGEAIKYKNTYLIAVEEIEEGKCTHCYFEYRDCEHIVTKCSDKIYLEMVFHEIQR